MTHRTDPRIVGGRYLNGYWRQEYTVTAITQHNDWRGLSWTCKWADGHTTEHSTAWDARRDKVLPTLRFRCSGRTSAGQDECSFTTDDPEAAMNHFEAFDHDVEDRENNS